MEEDIKVLEDIIQEVFEFGNSGYEMNRNELTSLENLLKRYKQIEEELNSVKEIYYTEKEVEELKEENATYRAQLNGAFDRGFIPISVIQNKLEKLTTKLDIDIERNNKTKRRIAEDYDGIYVHHIITYEPETIKRVLQELLEERE